MSNTQTTTHPTIPATDELVEAFERAFGEPLSVDVLGNHREEVDGFGYMVDDFAVAMGELTEPERVFCQAFVHRVGSDEPRPHIAAEIHDRHLRHWWVTDIRSECLTAEDAQDAVRIAAEAMDTLDDRKTGYLHLRATAALGLRAVDLGLGSSRIGVWVSRERIPSRHVVIDAGMFGVRDLVVAIYEDERTGPYWRVFSKPSPR